jgi:O-acetylhomoserine (thiol)-lyase
LDSSSYYKICKKQFYGNPGGLLTFDLENEAQCFKFMNKLSLIRRATNLNDNKTLIIHPYSTIYSEFSSEVRLDLGIRDTMMRLSVGIEDVQDIINDLEQALKQF